MSASPRARTVRTDRAAQRVDLACRAQRRGAGDPTHRRVAAGRWWRATRTPEGPVLLGLVGEGDEVRARGWGAGAEWALQHVPSLLGVDDDWSGFRPEHPVLAAALRTCDLVPVGRTDAVVEAFVPACIEQVVTGREAFSAFRRLVRRFGEPAPGPAGDPTSTAHGMHLQPDARGWGRIPSWEYLAVGVESRRSLPIVRAMPRAAALERTLTRTCADADVALRSLPGVGAWTSAEVRQRAHGDADAWSIGDYHVGRGITRALTGEELDDDACEELLEPYRGHRYRVQLLLARSGLQRERRGPRRELPTHIGA